MKLNIYTIRLCTFSLLIAAARCESAHAPPPAITGTITFDGSGASLTPGDGWYRYDPPTGAGVFLRQGTACGPIIANDSGMLSVSLQDKQHSSLQSMAARIRAECDSLAAADRRSFRREAFITESGLRGLHVSYVQRSVRDGRASVTRCHHYLVINRDGRGVDVAYLADAERDSKAAHQMIRKSLSLPRRGALTAG
jgi:hypothetical protein